MDIRRGLWHVRTMDYAVEQTSTITRKAEPGPKTVEQVRSKSRPGIQAPRYTSAMVWDLQRTAGNACVSRLLSTGGELTGAAKRSTAPAKPSTDSLARSTDSPTMSSVGSVKVQRKEAVNTPLQRDPAATPPVSTSGPSATVKHTVTLKDREFKDILNGSTYAKAVPAIGGAIDFEFESDSPAPAAGPATTTSSAPTPGTPSSPASPASAGKGPEIKSAYGANATQEKGLSLQAEVVAEFEKQTDGLLSGMTPKVKLGGEAAGDRGKLGIEFSAEGQHFEPKFAFNLLEVGDGKVEFLSLEAAVDWKMFPNGISFTTFDGTKVKISPKPTVKLKIQPNYEKILQTLVEEAAATIGAEALIAGGMIFAGAFAITGFILTYGDGKAYAAAIENAEKGRRSIVEGFVAGATGADYAIKDDMGMEGHNHGSNWRRNLGSGDNKSGLPVPRKAIDQKTKEHTTQIHDSAFKTASSIMHDALVERYWEIHYLQRNLPWAEIATTFKMLMEGQQFGRPTPEEGRTGGGVSVLPE
jgi:hypothetical protein